MNRHDLEVEYWDKAAKDPQVDEKYICNLDTALCKEVVGELSGKVLDLGCGVGRLMEDGYYGTDISEEMLKIAKERRPNCHFSLTDGVKLPFSDSFFDFVYTMLVFQHIPTESVINYIREVSRVLKKDGVFVFQYIQGKQSEPFSNYHQRNLILDSLKDNGFSVYYEVEGLIHPQWTWVKAKKI